MLQQLTALRLSWADWIFSIKAFVSAMLALYVAFRFDMQSQRFAGPLGKEFCLVLRRGSETLQVLRQMPITL